MATKKKFAVILSGCGVYDGAEIHESVLTLLAIDQAGAEYNIYAPDINQYHVVNHITGTEMPETRNVLIESARIARGNIKPVSELTADKADALIFPGGFGAAKNLCSFAINGPDCDVNIEIEQLIKEFHKAGKPIGVLCITPTIVAKVLENTTVTIGTDDETAQCIEKMGGKHVVASHGQVIIDSENKIYSTPCYMLDASITQIAEGAKNIVEAILKTL